MAPITMVYGIYNNSYCGESKPTNITFGGPTLYNSVRSSPGLSQKFADA